MDYGIYISFDKFHILKYVDALLLLLLNAIYSIHETTWQKLDSFNFLF